MSGAGSSSSVSTGKTLNKAFSKVDLDGHDLPPSPAPSSPRNGKKYAFATELVYTEGNDQYNASSTPIYQVWTPSDIVYIEVPWRARRPAKSRPYL